MLCVERGRATSRHSPAVPFGLWLFKKLPFRVLFLNHPSVKHACGAPTTVRPWRNKPSNLIFAPNPPRAKPIRLASPKLEAFAVDNTAKPAFREALVSFMAFRDKQCSRPTCHRAAQALLGPVASLVARFDGVFGADWPAWAPGAAYACLARVDRRVTGEQVCLRTTRWHAATSEGESRMARAPP